MKLQRLVALFMFLLAWATPLRAMAGDHIRVVFDTSISMRDHRTTAGVRVPGNDQGRLAALAALLLYDLAAPNVTAASRDSFAVYPFHPKFTWRGPSTDFSKVAEPIVLSGQPGPVRQRLVKALGRNELPYQAQSTSFYPGISAALANLEQNPGQTSDRRIVVLITDGVPDGNPSEQAQERQLLAGLVPRFNKIGARLFVLAFGNEADANRPWFDAMLATNTPEQIGKLSVDPTGDDLLATMIEVFRLSFGYTAELFPRAKGHGLDLRGSPTRDTESAIVVAYHRTDSPPKLSLTAPGGTRAASTHEGAGELVGSTRSFSVRHVPRPTAGNYTSHHKTPIEVAVLRPTKVVIDVQAAQGSGKQMILRAMSGTPLPLKGLVNPPTGEPADVPPLALHYEVNYGHWRPNRDAGYLGSDKPSAAPGLGLATGQGRSYAFSPTFTSQPGQPTDRPQKAWISLQAKNEGVLVGERGGKRSVRVDIYPELSMTPEPTSIKLELAGAPGIAVLKAGQTGCGVFTIELPEGQELPKFAAVHGNYPVQARLLAAPGTQAILADAMVKLDDDPVDVPGVPASNDPNSWAISKSWSEDEFSSSRTTTTKQHKVCVTLGPRAKASQHEQFDLQFILNQDPYRTLKVIAPLQVHFEVGREDFASRFRGWLLSTLAALALALAWYLRGKPDLPPDLGYAIAARGRRDKLGSLTLNPGTLIRPAGPKRWLGLAETAEIAAPGGRVLAHLEPKKHGLFTVSGAEGMRLRMPRDEDQGDAFITPEDIEVDSATVRAGVEYELSDGQEAYVFRLEYRRP